MDMGKSVRLAMLHKGQVWYSRERIWAVTYRNNDKELVAVVDGIKQSFSGIGQFQERYPLMKMCRDFGRPIRSRRRYRR
jgi:hypothetical protein